MTRFQPIAILPKISEVLHLAADNHLSDGSFGGQGLHYSCWAIEDAINSYWLGVAGSALEDRIKDGLETLGLNVTSGSEFEEFEDEEECQGARYAWLKFAALLAEEQGV